MHSQRFYLSVSELHAYHIAYSVLEKPLGVSDEEITWRAGLNGIWNIGNHNITIGIQCIIIANIPSRHVRETCPFIYLFFLVKDSPIWYPLCSAHTSQDSLSGRLWHGAMCKRTNKKNTFLNPLPLCRALLDIRHLPSRRLAFTYVSL